MHQLLHQRLQRLRKSTGTTATPPLPAAESAPSNPSPAIKTASSPKPPPIAPFLIFPSSPTPTPAWPSATPPTAALPRLGFNTAGRSLSAPSIAGMIAIADQARVANGLTTMDGRSTTLPRLYQAPATDFHDITSGTNNHFSAGVGYDLVSGRGTPIANLLLNDLSGISPALATPATPALMPSSDSGISNSDNITDVTTPTFTGNATAGSTVNLFADTTQVGTGIANTSGVWTITSSALTGGNYNITAISTSGTLNSNTSAALGIHHRHHRAPPSSHFDVPIRHRSIPQLSIQQIPRRRAHHRQSPIAKSHHEHNGQRHRQLQHRQQHRHLHFPRWNPRGWKLSGHPLHHRCNRRRR